MYWLKVYSNLLQNAVTSKYQKTDKHTATNINKEGVKHARQAIIIDRSKLTAQVTVLSHSKTTKRTFWITQL